MAINSDINLHHIVIAANYLCRKDDKFLFIRRSPHKIVAPNFLHIPGGKVDPTEDPLQAAERELFEETGIVARNTQLEAVITDVHSLAHNKNPNDFLAFYFSGEYASGELIDTDEGELLWLTKSEIDKTKMFPSTREVIDYIIDPTIGTVFGRFVFDDQEQISDKHISICRK